MQYRNSTKDAGKWDTYYYEKNLQGELALDMAFSNIISNFSNEYTIDDLCRDIQEFFNKISEEITNAL